MEGRCIGLDVHRDFCEVAIWEAGEVRRAPKVAARPEPLEEFASQLGPADRVALEATGNALAIARVIKPHVAQVMIVNTRRLKAISESKQKTDRHDAKTLAQLLAAGMLSGSWQPDETIRALRRRVARRARLVAHRARFKNEILAVLHRNLKQRPPMSDPSASRDDSGYRSRCCPRMSSTPSTLDCDRSTSSPGRSPGSSVSSLSSR
jgi:transposase